MSALVNGFERGFNMMERHKERIGRSDRLDRLDGQQEQRYKASQERLSQLDEIQAKEREKEEVHKTRMYEESKARTTNQKEYYQWQKNKTDRESNWKQDQPLIGLAWDYYRETGQVAPEHEETLKRNKGYDPRTFKSPEVRQKIKLLGAKMDEALSSGKISLVNQPETIQLFDEVFQDKISASVGEYDEVAKSKIKNVNFAGFVPIDDEDGSVTLGLKITYENGMQTIKAMSEGRTSDKDDPVLKMKPDELIATVQTKMMMADMIERPEYWDKMSGSVADRLSSKRGRTGTNQEDKTQAAYRKELTAINKDLTNAIAKIQGDSNFLNDEERNKAIDRVKALFKQRKDGLNKAYGIGSEVEHEGDNSGGDIKYTSKLEGQTVDSVIERFMSANKGMTKEQALSAAMKQGYISE